MKKFIEYFIDNSLIVNLISVALVIAGLMFVLTANREAFPEVDFGWVLIQTAYPGATASDVEKLVSKPIEDELREVTDGVKKVSSSSLEGYSVVAVELEADIKNKAKVLQNIKDAVDKVTDLPDDAEDPEIEELTTSQFPVVRVSLVNKNGIENYEEEMELRSYAKILKDRLTNMKSAASIEDVGYRDREMHVEVSLPKLKEYHIALNEITNALSAKNINFPGGVAQEKNIDVLIRTIGEFETAEEIAKIAVRSNDVGEIVTIGDVAKISDTFEKESIINKTNGAKCITLTVMIKEDHDIIRLVDNTKEVVKDFKNSIPDNYDIVLTDDLSFYVKRRLKVLQGNGIIGLALVVLSLFVALGWRISLVTAVGLPIAFAGTFWMMGVQDVSINLISMFALIMVLGMLVDDAIIVSENIYRHLEGGEDLKKAVINGTVEVLIPVAGTIMTTIAAFAPLMFMGGIMGKFMWALPACVSIALTMSWLESMLILPSHIYDIEKHFKNKDKKIEKSKKKKEVKTSPLNIRARYVAILQACLHHKYKFLTALSLFFVGSLIFAVIFVKFELFPSGGIEQFVVLAEAPTGTTLDAMQEKIGLIEKEISTLPDNLVESYISRTGIMEQEEGDPNSKSGSKYASIIINLTPFQARRKMKNADAQDVIDLLRKNSQPHMKEFAKVEIKMLENGPPTGADFNVNIKGEDFEVMKEIGMKYRQYLEKIDGLENIKDTFDEEKEEMRIYVKQDIAVRTGISVFDVANTVRSCYEGSVATEIKLAEEEIDVRVILPEASREDVDDLEDDLKDIMIANTQGALIPLKEVASFERGTGLSTIARKDWRRNLEVTADISEKAKKLSPVKLTLEVQQHFKDIEKQYPGYEVNYEGEFQDTQESIAELGRSYIIALLMIYIILVALFHNLRQPLIVLSIIPFTMCGVIWSFFVHSLPLSFMALMGIVGLAGVVVNDSIVYVDFINKARKRGKDAFEASLEAGYKRIRPILLTTVTTILGLIPTAYGIGGFDPFLKPMAVAMAYGLMFGTLITLFGTPAIYNFYYPKSCVEGANSCKESPAELIDKWNDEKLEDLDAV